MILKDKSIVVTGASSGMGKAIAERFVKEGASVIAVARRKERLDALAGELKDAPGRIVPFVGDVTKQEDNEAMIDLAVEQFGRLDVLVNNAGIMDNMSPMGDITNEMFEHVYRVNVFGPMYAMRKAVNVFLQQGTGGVIINVASLGCVKVVSGPAYCSSKAALVSMSRNTAFMYYPHKIRCNVIAPGGINTEIASSMGVPNMEGYENVHKVLAASPGCGEPEDVAAIALFYASDESRFINGDITYVDGGWNAG